MTRAEINLYKNNNRILSLYVHSDGYPESLGKQISNKFKDYEECDGIPLGAVNIYNGIEDFAIQLIYFLKDENMRDAKIFNKAMSANNFSSALFNTEAGYLYLQHGDEDNVFIDYKYNISSINNMLYIQCFVYDELVFDGTMKDFYLHINALSI